MQPEPAVTNPSGRKPEGESHRRRAASRLTVVRRVTLIGAVVDLLLGIAKIAGGWIGNSQALIADGVHSLSDLGTDVLVLVAAKAAHADADEEHPYGHARIETAATVGLGLALLAVAAGIVYEAVERLVSDGAMPSPSPWALGIAAVSVGFKEFLYHYTMHHARAVASPLLEANAWHSRSDAASSLVVIVGLTGSIAGWTYLDTVAAAVVGVLIARIGYRLCKQGVAELIDTGVEQGQLQAIRDAILAVDGVSALHELRTRSMGGRILIDVHIMLTDPLISVSEGHQVSETVRGRLIRRFDQVDDVMVHIDPEDDELYPAGQHLGLRSAILDRLDACWSDIPAFTWIRRTDLHYLQGQIRVQVQIPLSALAELGGDPVQIQTALQSAIDGEPGIESVEVQFVV